MASLKQQKENQLKGLCRCGHAPPDTGKTKCKTCREKDEIWYQRHRTRILLNQVKIWSDLKEEVLEQYGYECQCCGESYKGFLVLDHIKGGGTKERIDVNHSYGRGSNFYRWLKKQGYPNTVQVLCSNCNTAKGTKPYCPCPYSKQLSRI